MSNCENLEEYCLMYSHLWNCISELDDIGLSGTAYKQLLDWQWMYVKLIHETSEAMLKDKNKCKNE